MIKALKQLRCDMFGHNWTIASHERNIYTCSRCSEEPQASATWLAFMGLGPWSNDPRFPGYRLRVEAHMREHMAIALREMNSNKRGFFN